MIESCIFLPKPDKLNVVKARANGAEEWTVKTGKRGSGSPDFRVRLTDSGYLVTLRFHDAGRRPERYCRYLSAQEWREVKRKSSADFARLMASKVEDW
jgi:hypothetical protein